MNVNIQPSINLKHAIKSRRATRAFRSVPIPEVILKEILELSLRSPSGYNLQPWRFVVLKTSESKAKLAACAFHQRQITEAPIVIICCGDRNVDKPEYIESIIQLGQTAGSINETSANLMRSAIPNLFQNHPCFESIEAWTNRQTMLAVAHIMIIAKSYGVDSCPMEGFITSEVKAAFNIPTDVDVCCVLCLGYATEPLKQFGGRFSIDQVCYEETFGEPFHI